MPPPQAAKFTLRSIAQRIESLDREIAALDSQLEELVRAAAPRTIELLGISTGHAGQLLVTAGQNIDRLRGEASFAALCGASRIPASSGKTTRHRLNPGGDRQANRALHLIAVCRLNTALHIGPQGAPYIYSPAEITALMHAAGMLTPPLRAASYRTVIGVMATSGLRLGEALGLDRQDVDLSGGALQVRAGKQQKQREVPLHQSTTEALRRYARLRERRWPTPQTPAFFLNTRGGRLTRPEFNHTFAKLIGQVGLEGRGQRVRPRPHDLRHSFAVRTLLDWYHEGEDVDQRMPLLSTFLGHYAGDRVKSAERGLFAPAPGSGGEA